MMQEAIEAEVRPLAVREDEAYQSPALFGTSDPVDVITKATRVADALKDVIVKKRLVTMIQGREYPQVEAWQTLAVMLGLAAICEWSRQVPDGWEARFIVQRNGQTIAAAEAQCLRTERSKKNWEDYAIRSMAQTRANSKSLRSVLGFVMTLAGYEATPAEEMPDNEQHPPAAPSAPAQEQSKPAPANPVQALVAKRQRSGDTPDARKLGVSAIVTLCKQRGFDVPPECNEGTNVERLRDLFAELKAQPDVAPEPEPSAPTPPELPIGGNEPPIRCAVKADRATLNHLFGQLSKAGYSNRKDERLSWASSYGLETGSFAELCEHQARWLIGKADLEIGIPE